MGRLEEARREIDLIDRKIGELFEQRMKAGAQIGAYKAEHALPVLDAGREEEVLKKHTLYARDEAVQPYYRELLQKMMELSRRYQVSLREGNRIAYSGVEGAFAQIAAKRIFPGAQYVSCDGFESAYRAVQEGTCDACVLPIENSRAGEVGEVTDLMFRGDLNVSGVYAMPVRHNLLGVMGAKAEDVRRVVSHPQALSQCARFIRSRGLEIIEAENTAAAAKQVAKMNDPAVAAIASAETARLYGLDILKRDISESSLNTTRFAVFTRTACPAQEGQQCFILMFTVPDTAGALAEAAGVIGRHGFNLRVLRSRPMRLLPWQYYFYAEAEGRVESEEGERMLEELRGHCDLLKVAGHFPGDVVLEEGMAR